MIYGTPTYKIVNDATDRIGIRTITMSMMWQASRWPMSTAELDDEEPPPPPVSGGVMLIGKQTRPIGGGLRTFWTFEGVNGDGKSVTFKDGSNSPDFHFAPGFAEVSLMLHRNWRELRDKYSGQAFEGKIEWLDTLPDDAKGTKKAQDAGKANPLFGQQTYFRLQGTYIFRYAARTLAGLMGNVGKVLTSSQLPGKPPSIAGYNWLALPPEYQRHGPVFAVEESFWLSGEGGWIEQIYGKPGGVSTVMRQGSVDVGTREEGGGSLSTGSL